MPLAKSDYEAAMKIYYKPMKDMLENATALLSRLQRYEELTGGVFQQNPIRKGRTSSIGARKDTTGADDDLPVGGKPSYDKMTFTPTSQYATVRLTGFSMRMTKNPSFADVQAQTQVMEDTTKDFKKDINRQLFGVGSAELCQVNDTTTASVTACIVSSVLYPTWPTKFLYAGEVIDARVCTTGAAVALADSISVVSVDSTNQVTLSAGFIKTTTTQALYREDNVYLTSIKEMYGLEAALGNVNPSAFLGAREVLQGFTSRGTRNITNFGNISRATAGNEVLKGNELANGGVLRSFSVNLVEAGIDEAEIKGGGVVSLLQTNHPIYRLYGSLLTAAKQYEGMAMELDGGFKALKVNGIPMVKDVECPDYTIYCIDESTMSLGVVDDWQWLDDGGGILKRLDGKDVYEGVLVRDMQLLCNKPIANCVIRDVAHS